MNTYTGRKVTALKCLALTSTALVSLSLSATASAQDAWVGSTSADWFNQTNWNPANVPTSSDNITIDRDPLAPGYNPDINGVGGSAHANAKAIIVGETRAGALAIVNGGTLTSDQALLGNLAGSVGSALVSGSTGGVNASWTNNGDLIVGGSGTGILFITDGGAVTNAGTGIVGNAVGSTGIVAVDGAGATWTNKQDLVVGGYGAGTLNITNGGAVSFNVHSLIGDLPSATGVVMVDGPGSVLSGNAALTIGDSGNGSLTILNGGSVSNTIGTIAEQANSTGTVTVDGAGSTWTNSQSLTIGNRGVGTLSISNGGAVSNTSIGLIGGAIGSTGTVTVDGAGSTWTNNQDLVVGGYGAGTLNITNGGAVSFNVHSLIGDLPSATGVVMVDGQGSILSGNAALTVGDSGNGSLTVLNGGSVSNTIGTIAEQANSTGSVTVDGAGSTWTNSSDLYVGKTGTGTLTIANGGAVSDATGYLGTNAGSTGTLTVDGAGSTWTNSSELFVGGEGAGALTISNGGMVSSNGGYVGRRLGSNGAVTVTGVGSKWTSGIALGVGYEGIGTLTIAAGGTVAADSGDVGLFAGGVGTVTVDGAGSALTYANDLILGFSGGTGVLTVQNGGKVANEDGTLGSQPGSVGTANVTGAGSTWTNAGELVVGHHATGALVVSSGGMVTSSSSIVGRFDDSTGTVTVTGAASKWTNSLNLTVGNLGAGALNITNGGAVSNATGIVASGANSTGVVTVDGAGSTWGNKLGTIVGLNGAGTLNVTNGGLVTGAAGVLGSAAGSSGTATIDGAGSSWATSGAILVGFVSNGALTIANGGVVSAGGVVRLADHAGSTGVLNIGAAAGSPATGAGTLNAGTVEFGLGTGTLNFNHTGSNYQFNASMVGGGSINQYAGTTVLTGNSSMFAGETQVVGGRLLVNGTLGGITGVMSGGSLGGSGTLTGPVSVASGGTLIGVQGQALGMADLNLASGANVDVTLSNPGGAALFNITNDLTLDGALNITSGGAFGPGIYSLMTYGGVLTDNGLDIGTTPFGTATTDFAVQTAVAGQVNLVSTALPVLTFWDGNGAGAAGNGAIDGGDGEWTAAGTNWTNFNGSTNGAMHPQPGFAIFQGPAGTVVVDAAAGDVAVTGMQFARDGYQIKGDAITLADPNSIIRVGDGSAAGAGYSAIIGSVLTGTGGLNKTDLGTLILTADNNYTGGTTITGGTLQLGNGGAAGAIAGDIISNGRLVFNRSDAVSFASAISGSGVIEQNGAGTTSLTGDSSGFTGVVNVNSGTLGITGGGKLSDSQAIIANAAGSVGAARVDGAGSAWSNSGALVVGLDGNGALTIANGGAVSAGGTLTLAGNAGSTGVLNIGAVAGSPAAGAGTLGAAALQFGNGAGTLNFNHTGTNHVFASAMSGTGTINQLAGMTNLTGNSGGFSGAVNVNGGRLAVNGSLANGNVTVNSGGTLGGNGVIGSLTAQSGSIVAPGNSIGTLNVAGNAAFAAGSTYQVELNSAGQSDLINVAGTATIANGAVLSVTKTDAAPYVLGTRYAVLTAAGGVSGAYKFDPIQLTNFIGVVAGVDANSVYLDVAKTKTFASAGATPNQTATGGALDTLPLLGSLPIAIANLPTDASAQAAFDQLSGEIHASATSVMIEDSRFVREAAMDRLRHTLGGTDAGRVTLWGQGFGARARMDGDGNAASVQRDNSGLFIGADGMVGDKWRVGFIGGYSRSTFDARARGSSGTSDNYHVGAFAGTQQGKLAFRSGLAYTLHDISTTRGVAFPGFSDALKGDYHARTTQAFGELGYSLKSGKVAFEPFANLAYVNVSTSGFGETGGAAAFTSQGRKNDATFTTLGLRAASGFAVDNDMTITARGMLGWRHAFGDTTPVSTMAFAGGSPFRIGGVPIAQDVAAIDVGLDLNIGANTTLGVSYGGQFGPGGTDQTIRGSFVVRF